jgi:hypothetical protein
VCSVDQYVGEIKVIKHSPLHYHSELHSGRTLCTGWSDLITRWDRGELVLDTCQHSCKPPCILSFDYTVRQFECGNEARTVINVNCVKTNWLCSSSFRVITDVSLPWPTFCYSFICSFPRPIVTPDILYWYGPRGESSELDTFIGWSLQQWEEDILCHDRDSHLSVYGNIFVLVLSPQCRNKHL